MQVHVKASRKQRRFLIRLLGNRCTVVWADGTTTIGIPQEIEDAIYEFLGYGGARRGGKTDVVAVAAVLLCLVFENIKILILRKGKSAVVNNYRNLIQNNVLPRLGVKNAFRWFAQPNTFKCLATNCEIILGYLNLPRDIEQYIGNEFAFIFLEEGTQHEEDMYDQLRGSARGVEGESKMCLTCNPGGGPGHTFVNARFVNPQTRWPNTLWIKATPFDCPSAICADPKYIRRNLLNQPKWRQRQWIDGDWDVVAGSFWDLNPKVFQATKCAENPEGKIVIPRHADFHAGVDWGREAPFAVLFMATWREWTNTFPITYQDRAHIFDEIYQPGLMLDEQALTVLEKQAQLCAEFSYCGKLDEIVYYADWSVGRPLEGDTQNIGRTQANTWADYGWNVNPCRRAMKVAGWELMRMLMNHGVLTIDKERCPFLVNEMQSAVIEGAEDGGQATGEGMSKRSVAHAQDCARYVTASVYGLEYSIEDSTGYAQTPDYQNTEITEIEA